MRHQQVMVDYWSMVKTSCACLLLAFSGYILLKMVQTIFWLPSYLENNQKRLEELAAHYNMELNKEEEAAPGKQSDKPAIENENESVQPAQNAEEATENKKEL